MTPTQMADNVLAACTFGPTYPHCSVRRVRSTGTGGKKEQTVQARARARSGIKKGGSAAGTASHTLSSGRGAISGLQRGHWQSRQAYMAIVGRRRRRPGAPAWTAAARKASVRRSLWSFAATHNMRPPGALSSFRFPEWGSIPAQRSASASLPHRFSKWLTPLSAPPRGASDFFHASSGASGTVGTASARPCHVTLGALRGEFGTCSARERAPRFPG